jgi:hypothetical protein
MVKKILFPIEWSKDRHQYNKAIELNDITQANVNYFDDDFLDIFVLLFLYWKQMYSCLKKYFDIMHDYMTVIWRMKDELPREEERDISTYLYLMNFLFYIYWSKKKNVLLIYLYEW